MSEIEIWEVTASEDDFAKLDPSFAKTLVRCRTCLTYDVTSLSDLMFSYVPERLVLSFVYDTNVTLISTALLNALEKVAATPQLWECAKLRVTNQNVFAVRFSYRYQVRGTDNISYYLCPECGRESYVGFGERYLVSPNRMPAVSKALSGGLLIVPEVKAFLEASGIAGLKYESHFVRLTPVDDYPPILKSERRLTGN